MIPHWDIISLFIYLFLAIIGYICASKVKNKEGSTEKKQSIFSMPYMIWWGIWVFIATSRHIEYGIGGADALNYITYFKICLNSYIPKYFLHYDILYRLFNKAIRMITGNYFVFFIIVYGIIVYSYILFINEFDIPRNKKSSLILMAFPFLLSFNTLRTSLSISLILIGIVFLHREKNVKAFIFMFSTILIQKAAFIYASFYVFYRFYKKNMIKLKHCIAFSFISTAVGKIMQNYLSQFTSDELGGAYSYYATMSINKSFFDNFWKIAFGQLVVLGLILIFRKSIMKYINEDYKGEKNDRKYMIWTMCIYDIIMIPTSFILSIWRGYEYFYLARLIMYGEVLYLFSKRCTIETRKIVDALSMCLFICWFVFRLYNIWEDSCLMPYVFEFLI